MAVNKRLVSLGAALAAVASVIIGASVATYKPPTPTANGPEVFAQIKKAAKERKLSVISRSKLIFVEVGEEGLVEFSLRNERVKMVALPETHDLYQSELKKRRARLKSLGKEILGRARRIANAK